jgi:hypothetical protein
VNFAEFAQKECPELAPMIELPYGIIMADLEAELGTDRDWPKVRNNPTLLRGHAATIAVTRQVRAGQVPEGWTGVFQCAGCGSVYLQPGGPEDLHGCPWCVNRAQGLPIPRPPKVNSVAA